MRGLVCAGVVLGLCGCLSTVREPPTAPGTRPGAVPGAVEEGLASWYGPGFHGRATASGEVYNQEELTAAHRTLPLGTNVLVTNLDNGRTVRVRINDRGPFVKGRNLDLSRAAARVLSMLVPGTARVRIEVLGASPTTLAAAYTVQVGAFVDPRNARRLAARLRQRFENVYISQLASEAGQYYRVRLGRFAVREAAARQAQRAAALGLPAIIMEDGVAP